MEINNLKTEFYFHYINSRSNDSLFILNYGHEKCAVNKDGVGPFRKTHFLVHYVLEGEGTLVLNEKTYSLHKDDIFMIYPDQEFYYKQDLNNPWEYIWMEFNGSKAKDYCIKSFLTIETPTYKCTNEEVAVSLKGILTSIENEISLELHSLSHLYKFFALLINERNPKILADKSKKDVYIKLALNYIENHFTDCDLNLTEISKHININASYLSKIFKEVTGTTMSKYIVEMRIQKACELLETKSYAVKTVADMVGYSDPHFFSNEFKKHKFVNPKNYATEFRK